MLGSHKYRILYHHRTQALDGQRVHIREIQDALRALGHEVFEVAPLQAIESAGATARPTLARRCFGLLARRAPKALYEMLELAYSLAGYIKLSRAIRRNQPDFIYERYASYNLAGVWAARRFRLPLLLEVNSPLAEERQALGQLKFPGLARRAEKYVLQRATRVLAVTEVLRRILINAHQLDPDRVLVIQNGVRAELFDRAARQRPSIRQKLGLRDELVVGAAGFFREWHGIDLLLRCAAENSSLREKLRILLVGDGPALADLRQQAMSLGIAERVIFTGSVPHQDVPEHIAAMDIVLMPRAAEYASPLKLFEYMASAKAIVAPLQENLLEVLRNGHNAICVIPESRAALNEALQKLVEDESLRHRLCQAARQSIDEQGLTWSHNAERIVEVFESTRNVFHRYDRSGRNGDGKDTFRAAAVLEGAPQ